MGFFSNLFSSKFNSLADLYKSYQDGELNKEQENAFNEITEAFTRMEKNPMNAVMAAAGDTILQFGRPFEAWMHADEYQYQDMSDLLWKVDQFTELAGAYQDAIVASRKVVKKDDPHMMAVYNDIIERLKGIQMIRSGEFNG